MGERGGEHPRGGRGGLEPCQERVVRVLRVEGGMQWETPTNSRDFIIMKGSYTNQTKPALKLRYFLGCLLAIVKWMKKLAAVTEVKPHWITALCWIVMSKVGIPNFVSGPGEYIMEGEYVILKITGLLYLY